MGLFALPASRIPANLLPFLLRATLLETKLVMIFLHFVASLRFKSRFLPFLVNRAVSAHKILSVTSRGIIHIYLYIIIIIKKVIWMIGKILINQSNDFIRFYYCVYIYE